MVLIKDFKLPKGCYECSLLQVHEQGDFCSVCEAVDLISEVTRPECCPLVEIGNSENNEWREVNDK